MNAVPTVLCTDHSSLELSLGSLQVVPAREVGAGGSSAGGLPGPPRAGAAEEGRAHAQLGSWGSLEPFPIWSPRPWRGRSLFAFRTDWGMRKEREDLPEVTFDSVAQRGTRWGPAAAQPRSLSITPAGPLRVPGFHFGAPFGGLPIDTFFLGPLGWLARAQLSPGRAACAAEKALGWPVG